MPSTLPEGWPEHTLAPGIAAWCERWLRTPEGDRAGKPWVFTHEQLRFLAWFYALDSEGVFLHHRASMRWSKGAGKALALDTPLPTPSGWTTMGNVRTGDHLLDENGSPTTVTAATPTMYNHDCYKVSFRDGTSVVADADHLWPMFEFTGKSKREYRTVTTRELAENGMRFERPLTKGKTKATKSGVARWRTLKTPTISPTGVRTVTAVERVGSVPVRCVSVSGPSKLYLAGEGMVPTHNSPFAAAVCLAELCGPVRFDRWDGEGNAVGKPVPMPLVQIAATAQDQAVYTMSMVHALAPKDSPIAKRYQLDIGKTIIYKMSSGRLEMITSRPSTNEGARTTFVVADETEWWLESNSGHEMFSVLRRNASKMNGRILETCNAFVPGQNSIAEKTHTAWHQQQDMGLGNNGVLYDSREAPMSTVLSNPDSLREGLEIAYAGAPWVDRDRLIREIMDVATPPDVSRRFYLNQIVASSDAWLAPHEWGQVENTTDPLQPGDMITIGFDGSVRDDATAIVACRVRDGLLSLLGCWEKPSGPMGEDWQVDREAVDATIYRAREEYHIVGMYADPAHWQDYLDRWNSEMGRRMIVRASPQRPLEWWTNRPKVMVDALERFHAAVLARLLSHDAQPMLTKHVLNATRRYSRSGMTIAKEEPHSDRKIDACMAAVLAYQCRMDAVAKGLDNKRKRHTDGTRRRKAVGV